MQPEAENRERHNPNNKALWYRLLNNPFTRFTSAPLLFTCCSPSQMNPFIAMRSAQVAQQTKTCPGQKQAARNKADG